MDNYETTTTILAIRPKARGRNVPLRRMLANLSKLSVDGTQFFDTFTLFPRLQPELRQLIWAHACFQPRAVMLFVATDPHDLIPNRTYPGQRKLPAVLETCKESRDEALKHYTKTQEIRCTSTSPSTDFSIAMLSRDCSKSPASRLLVQDDCLCITTLATSQAFGFSTRLTTSTSNNP
ncbi:hypothetical protein DL98DRAFT_316512 [Cadophora sp. DSE1049]|nr:hypothetical protein DL98DRAFT_316512 [Cadophora sp. DSE1049]